MLSRAMVRRLPVLQNPDTDDAAAARRPRWHWVLIGAGFVITLFLPLSQLGVWVGSSLTRNAEGTVGTARIVLGAGPVAFSFLLACGLAGTLVGRFGGKSQAPEAALSGVIGSALVWALAAVGGALTPWPVAVFSLVVLVVFGGGAAFVGARLGLARRV